MTDEIDTSFPERIWAWADENDDKGWSLVPITGTMEGKPDPEYVRADLYDAERQRAEKAEALLENLVTGCRGYEPGLRQLLLNYYGDYFSAMKAAEYTEKYIAYLRQDEGGE